MIDWLTLTRDEKLAHIKPLWDEGKSAREISLTVKNASRNAIIGAVYRAGLKRAFPRASFRQPKPKREPRPQSKAFGPTKVPRAYIIAGSGAVIEKPPGREATGRGKSEAFLPIPGSTPIPWTLRAFGQCAWPIDGERDEQLSCGLSCDEGQTYCSVHLWWRRDKSKPPAKARNLMRLAGKVAA